MKKLLSMTVVLALTGCASFSTIQTDERSGYDDTGTLIEVTTITTKAKARTFFSAKSDLANWKAQQTDKTQGASVGSLSQQASGTNVVEILRATVSLLEAAQ